MRKLCLVVPLLEKFGQIEYFNKQLNTFDSIKPTEKYIKPTIEFQKIVNVDSIVNSMFENLLENGF